MEWIIRDNPNDPNQMKTRSAELIIIFDRQVYT